MYDLICIYIGNSSIHLGYFENGVLIQSKNIPTHVVLDFPREILPLINKGTPISYCNVVPCIEKEIQVIFKENNNGFLLNLYLVYAEGDFSRKVRRVVIISFSKIIIAKLNYGFFSNIRNVL